MVNGADLNDFRLLLLETGPETLADVRALWAPVEVAARSLSDSQGLADQVSREKPRVVVCELAPEDPRGLRAIQQLRRVHPQLPLVAVLPDGNAGLLLAAFRHGVNDVLIRPVNEEALREVCRRIDLHEALNSQQTRAQQAAKRSLDDLILLKAVGETMHRAGDLQQLLEQIVDLIQRAMAVDIVSLLLADDDGNLRIRAARGLPDEVLHEVTIAPGEGVSGYVMAHGEPVLIDDLSTDGRFPLRSGQVRYRTGSLLSVPIRTQQRLMGVLNVNNKRNGEAFTGSDQELLLTIAHQTALAIENTKLVGRLQEKNLEVERAHADLVKLHQDRTRFVCNLSHELKTPLTSVLGFADLLSNFFDQIDVPRQQEYIGRIYSEGKHLQKLLTGMLRLFSIDSGSESWQWQSLSLQDSLGRVLGRHGERMKDKHLALQVTCPEDLMPVWGDEEKLDLLLDALVDNAIKFNRECGELAVNAGNLTLYGRPMVYMQIANHGHKVAREDADNIFQEYSQLGELDVGKPSGVGIGLATCRAILRQMQGDIFLEPRDDDEEGTSIALLLPTENQTGS